MKQRLFILIVIIVAAIACLYLGYEKYKANCYKEVAMSFKESVYKASRYAGSVIEETHKSKLKCSDILKSAQGKHFKDENESKNYHAMVLKQVIDIQTGNDNIKKKSIDVMDSSLKNANACMKEMRKYKDCYPEDHSSFENALKLMRNLIKKYKNEEFTLELYNISKNEISEIEESLSETDVDFKEISEEKQLQISLEIAEMLSESNLNIQ